MAAPAPHRRAPQPAAQSVRPCAPWRRWIWCLLAPALLIQVWTLPAQWVSRLAHVHVSAHLVARSTPHDKPAAAVPARRPDTTAWTAWVAPPRRSLFEHRQDDDHHLESLPVAVATAEASVATKATKATTATTATTATDAAAGAVAELHDHAELAFHEHDHDDTSVVHIDAQGRHSAATAAAPVPAQRGLNDSDALPLPARLPGVDQPRPVWVGDAPAWFQSHIGSLLLPPPRRTA